MFGAIIEDIVGSRFEFNNCKNKNFNLFDNKCRYTDDTVMTLAICKALMECNGNYNILAETTIKCMQELGGIFTKAGYGEMFYNWLKSRNPKPYNSLGNGAAMRVSSIAYEADTIEQVKKISNCIYNQIKKVKENVKCKKVN